ncbi:Uma2 family endonuclease [Oscillatoriales cyanobacterium LEGE 11467]|uniref:Uma2 family endonuclease n=1 Tax=Zarconia navalis LEGE 11467 TaxID=1828826 RepID=A0A928W384_9CYAN|nr:Uma2 family endonuclease [Zarconia navalis]MBE9042390.1 Uma2 family endonuclease [Zarconia navalis LEGE 11467]
MTMHLPTPIQLRQDLPTMYDLPSENPEEPGLPDEFHGLQPQLLQFTFQPPNWSETRRFVAMDMNLYYDVNHPLWYKRPDWFGVVGVSRLYEEWDSRLSYVIWQEGISPFVIVELLSPGTEDEDFGETESQPGKPPTKWQVYEEILQVPYYFIFDRYTDRLQGFHLVNGRYQPLNLRDGRGFVPELGLSLGLWRGIYQGLTRQWLRWMKLNGERIALPQEEAEEAKQEAQSAKQETELAKQETQSAKQEAELAKQRAERLAEQLRQMGIDPEI